MKKRFFSLAAFLMAGIVCANPSVPFFQLSFDDGVQAVERGKKVEPAVNTNTELVQGVSGKAIKLGVNKSALEYDLNDCFDGKSGTVMYWIKREVWDGGISLFRIVDADNKPKFQTSWSGFITPKSLSTFQINEKDSKTPYLWRQILRQDPGTWHHVALTWKPDGTARMFVDALPYSTSNVKMKAPDLDGLKKLVIGKSRSFIMDEIKFYKEPLSNQDIWQEYRKIMPVDMVVERSVLNMANNDAISIQLAPGGYYMRPHPVPGTPEIKAKNLKLSLSLRDSSGKTEPLKTQTLSIEKQTDVVLPPRKLPPGAYELIAETEWNGKHFSRTFALNVINETYQPATPSNASLEKGRLIFQQEFSDPNAKDIIFDEQVKQGILNGVPYLEAGAGKRNRFSSEVIFPSEVIGKPVILEMEWPDDKLRNMAILMFRRHKPRTNPNRDRLQSGIQSGEEFPNTGKMQTISFIFYPGVSEYLLEARTLAPNAPAALRSIRVYEAKLPLPALKIHEPEGLPKRTLGFFDEDQTFFNNLNVDFEYDKKRFPTPTAFICDELFRYFEYTGQNNFLNPIWRYHITHETLQDANAFWLFPCNPGEISYILDAFAAKKMKFTAMSTFHSLPEIRHCGRNDFDYVKAGMVMVDQTGKAVKSGEGYIANISHPEVGKLFRGHFREILRRYGKHPGLGGIAIYGLGYCSWMNYELGYDDLTLARFTKDTGIKVQGKDTPAKYLFLTNQVGEKWLEWRAKQVTKFFAEFRAMMNEYNHDLPLLILMQPSISTYERGFNPVELGKIPGVRLSLIRRPTRHRHDAHWGRTMSTWNESQYDPNLADFKAFEQNGALASVVDYYNYFEMKGNTLLKDKFNCTFVNADPKANGRYYLKESAFVVGIGDVQDLFAGGQPLPSVGKDAETREFAQAFRALPAVPFKTVSGSGDPSVVRYLQTKNGTYFYAVNMTRFQVDVKVELPGARQIIDLSTDATVPSGTITLKPFQLRSFLIPKQNIEITKFTNVIPKEVIAASQVRLEQIATTIKDLNSKAIETKEENILLQQCREALKKNHLAEVDRLAFSKMAVGLFQIQNNFEAIKKSREMMKEGFYMINCGSPAWYQTPKGALFFPDKEFEGDYGYQGKYNTTTREEIKGMKGAIYPPDLFLSEAYDIDSYLFKVPNGTYRVLLHHKWGYRPSYGKANLVFTVEANGGISKTVDIFKESKGDFDRAFWTILNHVKVTDGILRLKFTAPPGSETVRMVNAIEVKRTDKKK